ncbi:MAG TPA: hypothetical protein VEV17_01740 [Bryobacteraceae bacterium]|nr:hypothetical protein [Bryobacteraceae bacterium]
MDFRDALTSKDRDAMLNWIRTAAHSGIGPLVRFAYGLKKDLGDSRGGCGNALEPRSSEGADQPSEGQQTPNVWPHWLASAKSTRAALQCHATMICTESAEDPF